MRCFSFFINKTFLGKKTCVGTCLKCLTVATPLDITQPRGLNLNIEILKHVFIVR